MAVVRFFVGILERILSSLDGPLSRLLPVAPSSARVIAHRGSPAHPENSIEGLAQALADGAAGVEFDIVIDDDGIPRVAHHLPAKGAPPLEQAPSAVSEANRVYVHYKRENECSGSDVARHAHVVAKFVADAGMADTVVIMVESGNLVPWSGAGVRLLQCWSGPYPQPTRFPIDAASHGHVGVYHTHKQLSRPGRWLHRLGMVRVGTWLGIRPTRRMVRGHPGESVVFTLNDPFLMRVYAAAGFDAVGTDCPDVATATVGQEPSSRVATRRPSNGI